MADAGKFMTLSGKTRKVRGDVFLPGGFYAHKAYLSEKEISALQKQMEGYILLCKNTYDYTNWEHSECDSSGHFQYTTELFSIEDRLKPIYLLKAGKFFGLVLSLTYNGTTRRGVFLIDGTTEGRTIDGYSESYGHVDKEDTTEYFLIKKG